MEVNNYIVLSVGQAGNQIATHFWQTVCKEHGIDPQSGLAATKEPAGNWKSFFSRIGESQGGSYAPRAIMVDLEPSVIEETRKTCGSLFNPANLISRVEGAGGNFAVGYLTEGREVLDQVLERLEHEISKCDQMGGIFVFHSLGGGTGSGLGCLLMEAIRQHHPEVPIIAVSIFPSPQVSSVVTEPYNTVFAMHFLRKCADACIVFDNEALFQLANRRWGLENPSIDDLNQLITEALAGLTASMRFSGFLTVEISARELMTNLVPQPSLHFLTVAFAPLNPPEQSRFEEIPIGDMIESLFDNNSFFAACSPMDGRFLASAVLYRGILEDKPQADASLAAVGRRLPLCSWIPTAFKIGYVEQPGTAHRKSMVLLANNTEINRVIARICTNFDKLWQRKAFLNWYLGAGMTEEQIAAMRASSGELVELYRRAEESGASSAGVNPTPVVRHYATQPVSPAPVAFQAAPTQPIPPQPVAPSAISHQTAPIQVQESDADALRGPIRLRDLVEQRKNRL